MVWKFCALLRYLLRPTVYVCQNNGLYSLVRPKDYNRAARRHWWMNEKYGLQRYLGWENGPRIHVENQILFGWVKTTYPILTGDWDEMFQLLEGCRVEARQFNVPAPWENFGESRVYTMDEARELIRGSSRRQKLFTWLRTPFSGMTA